MPKTTGNIILVGPMGAGKTTIGRQLARLLKRAFVDSDKEIVARTGAAISLIFELEGESGFRKREKAMIDELTQREDTVIATGGGAVLDPENRAWMQARGFVIYLKASVDKLLERTGKDKGRPLLQTENPRQTLLNILEARDAYYREVADVVIETNGCTARSAVRKILRLIPQKAD